MTWVKYTDPSIGKNFYAHDKTGQVVWKKPKEFNKYTYLVLCVDNA